MSIQKVKSYHRSALAKAYCDSLTGKGILNAQSGLFLAAPRRVGKSTFLIEDLIPEATARRFLPIYIDLWANRAIDPAILIIEAIKTTLASHASALHHLKQSITKIRLLNTVELDLTQSGLPKNVTLTDLLQKLHILTQKPILLLIDEAQHALISNDGMNAMFAVKSARDQINLSHGPSTLMLVLTGSNRDKLAQLIVKKDQPFFGAEITLFPLLGRDFIDHLTQKINESLALRNQFTVESVWEAFQLVGHRPEILRTLMGKVAIENHARSFSDLLKQDAALWHMQIWREFEDEFNALSALQQTLLSLLIKMGKTWSPFSEESMVYYREKCCQPELAISTVQTALIALRDRGIVWQSGRGVYALEDETFAHWFSNTRQYPTGN